jgi:hypothetical protein
MEIVGPIPNNSNDDIDVSNLLPGIQGLDIVTTWITSFASITVTQLTVKNPLFIEYPVNFWKKAGWTM